MDFLVTVGLGVSGVAAPLGVAAIQSDTSPYWARSSAFLDGSNHFWWHWIVVGRDAEGADHVDKVIS